MFSVFYFLLLLGGLILIHELGHFVVAKLSGVKVLTFSLGFGPALLKKKWGDTEYKLAAVPLGGYVRMYGDEPDSEVPPDQRDRAFNYKPLWMRSAIVLAGPVANLILPFVVFFFLFFSQSDLDPSYIGSVKKGGPAWNAGLRAGDTVVSINGDEVAYWWQLQDKVNGSIESEMEVVVEREGKTFTTKVTPVAEEVVKLPRPRVVDREGRIQVVPHYVSPIIATQPGGIAHRAGLRDWDRVVGIDGKRIDTFVQLRQGLGKPGPHRVLALSEQPLGIVGHGNFNTYGAPEAFEVQGGSLDELGLYEAEMVVHHVDPGSKAEEIGLKPGDRIISVDGEEYPFWFLFESHLAKYVEDELTLSWHNSEGVVSHTFSLAPEKPEGEEAEGEAQGPRAVILGAYNHSSYGYPASIPNDSRLAYALVKTWKETALAYKITLASVAGLVMGEVPIKEMGGPILIYQMAARTEEQGWGYFFTMMVWLSISLGVINLFPVPILDGGHLVFFAIEAVMRRPVSIKIRQIAAYVGLFLLVMLMVVVFANDIVRDWDQVFNAF